MQFLNGYVVESEGVWKFDSRLASESIGDAPDVRLRHKHVQANQFVERLLAKSDDAVLRLRSLASKAVRTCAGYVKLKAFASDRITVTTGRVVPGGKPAAKWKTARPKIGAVQRLERHRKSRRGFQVGGRWRDLPMRTRFTRGAKNLVRDAAHLMEREKRGQGVFCTLTVAGGTDESYRCLSAASGYIVDRFNRWIRYKVQDSEFLYVWELQDRGAPHLHYMFRISGAITMGALHDEIQSEWRKILLDVTSESGVDLFARRDGGTWLTDTDKPFVALRSINGNLRDYLSKYLSKSRSKSGSASVFRPGRWAAISANLRRKVMANRLTIQVLLPTVEHARCALTELISYAKPLTVSLSIVDKFMQFDCLMACLDCKDGGSVPIAKAMAELLHDGNLCSFATLAKSYSVV